MTATTGPGSTFGEALRAGTRALHLEVERSAFMQRLLGGALSRPGYCALLRNLHPLYATLEPALRRHPALGPVCLPGLERAGHLAKDLSRLHGPGWAEALPLLPAARGYVERLLALDSSDPWLLVAHVYVRYLGDLNGGQALERIVAGSAAAGVEGATSFYDFGGREGAKERSLALRSGLSALGLGASQEAAVVEEARSGFERHRALFAELEALTAPGG